jgi:hypothetical protein
LFLTSFAAGEEVTEGVFVAKIGYDCGAGYN